MLANFAVNVINVLDQLILLMLKIIFCVLLFREFLVNYSPCKVFASCSYSDPNDAKSHMVIEQGDAIVVIDGRSELKWWKGQNQRTYEINTFLRYIELLLLFWKKLCVYVFVYCLYFIVVIN